MNTAAIRQKFLDFFGRKEHIIKESFSLIPQDDPTLLFISAGMAPLKPYFLGTKTDMKRAATCQKCFRTTDIDNVGYTARHHTFFEMLGNFSFGDYFKKEAIAWAWEFITKDLGLEKSRLHISVHTSDDEAWEIWHRDIGISEDHLVRLGDKDNFWTIGVGPSGPCSEIYIDQGAELSCKKPSCAVGCDCSRYLEFWNLVFTQYNRAEDGKLTPLEKCNIDTGMGLERLATIIQGKTDNFHNDVFSEIVSKAESLTNRKFGESPKITTALKVVSDHIRALSFAIADGALPGNEGRGYVLRKILRRASRFGYSYLQQEKPFLYKIVPTVIKTMSIYPELLQSADHISLVVQSEEERFMQTLKTGSEILSDYIAALRQKGKNQLDGTRAFLLHDTYGFPLDLTREICREEQITVEEAEFNNELEKQRERGRANIVSAFVNFSAIKPNDFPPTKFTGYSTLHDEANVLEVINNQNETLLITDISPFYGASGGQIGDSGQVIKSNAIFDVATTDKVEEIIIHRGKWRTHEKFSKGDRVEMIVTEKIRRAIMRNHTTTHILHKALQEILGTHVKQAGSLVAADRLRFDFTHFQAIPTNVLYSIEKRVNEKILEGKSISTLEADYQDAVKTGAMALFGEKYGDVVRVVKIGDYSQELCGGTHLTNSAEAGLFQILSESSVAAGIRRIEAITGEAVYARIQASRSEIDELAQILDCDAKGIIQKSSRLIAEFKETKRELDAMKKMSAKSRLEQIKKTAKQLGEAKVILSRIDDLNVDEMKELTDEIISNSPKTVVLMVGGGEKVTFVLKISQDLVNKGMNAGKLIKEIAKIADGGGGGRPDMATAGGKDPTKINEALIVAETLFETALKAQSADA